jgi:halocyanin-like protein
MTEPQGSLESLGSASITNAEQATPTRSTATLGRRGFLQAGVAAGSTAAMIPSVTAQESPYGGWFDDTDTYNGTVDGTGRETVTVSVGAGDSGLAFEPAAIAIDPGTTVIWEWTGEGGGHNVAAEDGSFESQTVSEAGHTFEHTFGEDTNGDIFKYVCVPHQALGMVGAIAVGDAVTPTADAGSGSSRGTESGSGTRTESDTTTGESSSNGLSSDGQLALLGGVLGTALLSPVFLGIALKLIYDDDRQPEHPIASR